MATDLSYVGYQVSEPVFSDQTRWRSQLEGVTDQIFEINAARVISRKIKRMLKNFES